MRTALRRAVLSGLGMLAGAVLSTGALAQVPVKRDTLAGRPDTLTAKRDTMPTRVDSVRARQVRPPSGADTLRIPLPPRPDSMIRNDSAAQGILGRGEQRTVDTLKAPLPRAEAPALIEIGASRVYDRAAIFATGALTLSDLLGRVPGLTTFATGWLVAPTGVASQGDFRRIRVFLDGIELDPMQQREQGRAPVNDVSLHTLEELRIERGADEVRVYARSWRVVSTTPSTRADVLTGDQNSNLYRGYFGRRYSRGEALQVSAEQLSTQPISRLPSSDGRAFMVRAGLARGPWSADLTGQRVELSRDFWIGQGDVTQTRDTIAPLSARRTTIYLRLANGDPDASRWLQLVASSHAFTENPASNPADTVTRFDTNTYENQYLVTGGLRKGFARVSAAGRVRTAAGATSVVPSARASVESEILSLSLLGEGASPLSPWRAEGTGRLKLLDRIAVMGAVSRTGGGVFDRVMSNAPPTPVVLYGGGYAELPLGPVRFDSVRATRYELIQRTSVRAEGGLRLGGVWLSGGMIQRGPVTLLSAAGLGTDFGRASAVRSEDRATGRTAAIRGHVWRALNVDAWAIDWGDTTGFYRPRYQTRSELYLQSNLLNRFPRGNFGILASVAHEYRSNARFPVSEDSVRTAPGYRTLDFRLEIRVQTAVISYQFRNTLQERYSQVPGFQMPRQTQFYGVRWDFWN